MSDLLKMTLRLVLAVAVIASSFATASAVLAGGPVIFEDDFENGAGRWKSTDASAWKVTKTDKGSYFSLIKDSNYSPPHTSPLNIAWLQGVELGDFQVTMKVRSTTRNYGHRDICFFLGRQDAAHFYYCHVSKAMDDRANQIFIVNGAARTKISEKTTDGTPWDDNWHDIKIVRKLGDGLIEVYFDDMETPIMVAHDKTFGRGGFGIGSFDDTADYDDIKITSLEATGSSGNSLRGRRLLRRQRRGR